MLNIIFIFYINIQNFLSGSYQVYNETLADCNRPETKQCSEVLIIIAHPATANSTRVPSGFERERKQAISSATCLARLV